MRDLSKDGAYWDNIYTSGNIKKPEFDGWLEQFEDIVSACTEPVLDIGCGSGADTAWFLEKGRRVVACDRSKAAVEGIERRFPQVRALDFDMLDGLPFPDGSFGIVCADLSLHYFGEEDTFRILGEIKRVLSAGGYLLARVNCVADVNYGAGRGEETERHLYRMPDGRLKRFFDREDVEYFFSDFHIVSCAEQTTDRYGAEKEMLCICAVKAGAA